VQLAVPSCFAANPKNRVAPEAQANADRLVDSMLGRHCAGLRSKVKGGILLKVLCSPPVTGSEVAEVIRWLFGSIWIQDLHKLAWRCGIPIICLAEHVRAVGATNRHVILWLNQFAVTPQHRLAIQAWSTAPEIGGPTQGTSSMP